MSFEYNSVITKENLNTYLKELGKEFRKLNGISMPAEIILVGGAAVLVNYGFRDMTTDVDAVIHASSSMKDAVNRVGDKFHLPREWLNSDFMHTSSYSARLGEISVYYKTFSNVLQVRTISGEYLVAMKLRAGRKYKNDLSDIIGILLEHEKQGTPLTAEKIDSAVRKLYGDWSEISKDARIFIEKALENRNYGEIYASVTESEKHAKDILIGFAEDYPGRVKESNVNEILSLLMKRKGIKTKSQESEL